MYHCHIQFYLLGTHCRVFDLIREMSVPNHFTYDFFESQNPESLFVEQADVILANLQDMDVEEAIEILATDEEKDVQIILLADKEQILTIGEVSPKVQDIWTMPMSDHEIRFRFLRWQQNLQMSKDYWQTSQYLEATINHVPNLIWYKNKDGIHEKVNDSFCRTVNKTKKQVEGRGHAYIWDVEHDDPACIESEREVMEKKATCISEETIKTGEGMRLLTTYKSPLYDLDGSVMGTVGVAIDVTQERTYEHEIMQKNHTLETIFTSMDCGVMCHSVDGERILSVNRAALRILGYESREEMVTDGFDMVAESVLDEDREKLRACITELREEGDAVSVEYRIRHKSGEVRHVMGNIKLLKEDGELFYQRFLLDCTAQKLQEEKNERRQTELIHALTIDYNLVCFFDMDTGFGALLQIGETGRRMFGDIFLEEMLHLDSAMDTYIEQSVYEEDRDMVRKAVSSEHLREKLKVERQCHVNYRAETEDGMKYFQIKVVRAGTWNENHGIVLGFRSVDEEIRKEMEKKSMLEDALMQANRASKAKSVFLSNMSHDIRTPMNAIVGFTTLALTHIERKGQVEEYLKKIMTSGNHLLSLINDVLDMSRIESGKIYLEEKSCHLPEILYGLRNIVQADVRAKQLELHIDTVDVMNEQIYCDKLRLNQLLLNLLSNAIKYTGSGGTISMRITEKAGAPEGYANFEFHIKDTGIGMSEEFVANIFEPFERESNSTISRIQGTGLGMAISKNIVDMMNGTIEVQSEQGVGTEVILSVTFKIDEETKTLRDIPQLKNCRALVVDDDFNTCDSVSYMLQQTGMRAEWTLSGKEAVLRTRQAKEWGDQFSVYIIDWLLPDMNGVDVARKIREEIGEDVPIIVLTAYDWSEIEEEAKEAGVTKFCRKPLFFSELRNCLYSIVNGAEECEHEADDKKVEFEPGCILLAEDNELNQEIAEEILKEAGFSIEIAENGQEALDMLTASEPGYYQLVLMDVQMPVMNGHDAAKAIRRLENEKLASIPILAMTANAFEEDKRQALMCGMNGHIAKPIDVDRLFEALSDVLG